VSRNSLAVAMERGRTGGHSASRLFAVVLATVVVTLLGRAAFTPAPSTLSRPSSPSLRSAVILRASKYDPPSDLKAPMFAERTSSGLASQVLSPGKPDGSSPGPSSSVKVQYTGWKSSNGEMFDSTYLKNQPAEFKVNEVIPGWTEGLQLMKAGERRRIWIPGAMAYGEESQEDGSGRPYGDLVFDVELVEVENPGEGIITGFAGALAFLLFLSFAVATFSTPAERSEYDDPRPFGFRPSAATEYSTKASL